MADQYSIQEFAAKIRERRPDLANIPDMTLVGKTLAAAPELKQFLKTEAEPYRSPRYGATGASPGMVASDQAANVLQGIPQAVTGIPGMIRQGASAGVQALMGNARPAAEMAMGAAQPFVTAAKGAGALAGAYGAPVPGMAPSEQDWQQAAQGAGAQLGATALPNVLSGAGEAVRPAMARALTNTATRLYESALKPGPRSNTLPEVQRMVETGLREGIPVTERGAGKLNAMVDALNKEIKNTIDTGNQQGATVNKYAVASRLSDTARRFANQVNPETDLATVSESGNEFLRNQPANIQASMAQALKQGTYQQLKNRAYGELKGAAVESQKTLARGLKEELAAQFPEIRDMNLRESDLLQLKDELESAVNRQRNKEMFGIGTPILGAGVKAVTGSTPLGLMSGVARSIIDRPGFKSKLAIALARAGRP